ncbi:MAG: hypothetical protein FJ267_01990, partial [Planctomycetes bacterium]|nr:hypothetical protein [Planctomycetota bacterium]
MSSLLKSMTALVLLIAGAIGGTGYWFYMRSEKLLRDEVLRQLQLMTDDLKFEVDRACWDFSGRVCLYGLSVSFTESSEPCVDIPEAIISFDQQQLTDLENLSVRRVQIVNPRVRLKRDSNGNWNIHKVNFRNEGTAVALPDIEVEHGQLAIELAQASMEQDRIALDRIAQDRPTTKGRESSRRLSFNDLNLTFVPSSLRQVKVDLSTRMDQTGPLEFSSRLNLDGAPWKSELKWKNVPIDDELLSLVGDLSPQVREKLEQARLKLSEIADQQKMGIPESPVIPGGLQKEGTPSTLLQSEKDIAHNQVDRIQSSDTSKTPFGLKCVGHLEVRIEQEEADLTPRFQGLIKIVNGQVSNSLLPFPLYDLRGQLYVDHQSAVLKDFHAENGETNLDAVAQVRFGELPSIKCRVNGIELNENLRSKLPAPARKLLKTLSLTGTCDARAQSVIRNGKIDWDADLWMKEGTASHAKFPYPIHRLSGTVKYRESVAQIEAEGKAGVASLMVNGTVRNPGIEQEADFIIQASGMVMDSQVLAATPPVVTRVLKDLDLQGRGNVWFRAYRPEGLNKKFDLSLNVKMLDGSCSFVRFPYKVNRLRGIVQWAGDLVTFKDLVGEHDGTELSGEGQYRRTPAPGKLDLTIQARNAAFDRALEAAVPPSLRLAWREFQPQGHFDCLCQIEWIPGMPCDIALPQIRVKDGDFQLKSFPWPVRDVTGEFAYKNPRLEIKAFKGRHDDTELRCRGNAMFLPGEPWRVEFDEAFVDDLVPNGTFRDSLPEQLR